jgi:formylglycine-generating enzyme required for sulfatase activity
MKKNPSNFKKCGDDCPVEKVSWNDAENFIKKLNEIEGTDKYRLPTEAEWENACRVGTTTDFFFGNDAGKLGQYAWYKDNSEERTHPVGQKKPNAWGLYDMHGNVWEWVEDDWHENYKGAPTDGSAWVDKGGDARRVVRGRMVRGGSWFNLARLCRSAYRRSHGADDRFNLVGFRLARSIALGP